MILAFPKMAVRLKLKTARFREIVSKTYSEIHTLQIYQQCSMALPVRLGPKRVHTFEVCPRHTDHKYHQG